MVPLLFSGFYRCEISPSCDRFVVLDELEWCMVILGFAISSEASCHLAHELDVWTGICHFCLAVASESFMRSC
jgi:hypothetical protein